MLKGKVAATAITALIVGTTAHFGYFVYDGVAYFDQLKLTGYGIGLLLWILWFWALWNVQRSVMAQGYLMTIATLQLITFLVKADPEKSILYYPDLLFRVSSVLAVTTLIAIAVIARFTQGRSIA